MIEKRFSRLLALLMLFCYGGFSLVGSCLHTHLAVEESDAVLAVSVPVSNVSRSVPSAASAAPAKRSIKGTALRAAPKTDRCLACDWQAANVSAALTPAQFVFAYLPQTDIHVAAPRAPSVSVCLAVSRGPPSA